MGPESPVFNTSDHLSCVVKNHRRRDGQGDSGTFSNWSGGFGTLERKGSPC